MKVFVVDAVRTPVGNKHGVLNDIHAVDLAAVPLRALLERNEQAMSSDPSLLMGCATPIGEQGMNVARSAALAAGWSSGATGTTVDAGANSSIRALRLLVSELRSGAIGVGVAAGVASMSRVPVGSTAGNAVGKPFGPGVHSLFENQGGLLPPGLVAEALAKEFMLSREALDAYAMESHLALNDAQFKASIVPVTTPGPRGKSVVISNDEKPASGSPMFAPVDFVPAFDADGVITAGNFAGPADGSAAVLLANEEMVKAMGLTPLAEVVSMSGSGSNPNFGSSGSLAFASALKAGGLTTKDIDQFVVHEDSAVTPLAFASEQKVTGMNPVGGALGLGDPLGAGTLITFVHSVATLSKTTAVVVAGASGQQDCVVIRSSGPFGR